MKQNRLKNFLLIAVLIAATGVALAYSSNSFNPFSSNPIAGQPGHQVAGNSILTVSGHLIQNKVLQGSEGRIGLNLVMQARDAAVTANAATRNVDLVIVLDRSGSMKGPKISDARAAVLQLLSNLTDKDRLALVTYSDGVQIASGLLNITGANRQRLEQIVRQVQVGGGTNLGAGLQAGINLLRTSNRSTNAAKVILISDGLANQGITDGQTLSRMAAVAVENEFAVSTVGVGNQFNEYLMTAIADQGTGSYYYLENPAAFAEVFQKEFQTTRTALVDQLQIQIPLKGEIRLADAAGYPISRRNGHAIFRPGVLRSGQKRNLYLTLQVPTNNRRNFELSDIKIVYQYNNQSYETILEEAFKIACVADPHEVMSSIDKTRWSQKVLNEDFNRLKQEVAADMKAGKKLDAMKRIEKYHGQQQAVNQVLGSAPVSQNLDRDVKELESFVEETFQGAPEVIRQ